MNKKILKILNRDSRTKIEDIAVMVGLSADEVKAEIEDAIGLDTEGAGLGFEEVAERVMKYPEVESVYLMSGSYDLSVIVKGKTFQQVATFVAKELATIDSVISTATHFVLRRYKELDTVLYSSDSDDRGSYLL